MSVLYKHYVTQMKYLLADEQLAEYFLSSFKFVSEQKNHRRVVFIDSAFYYSCGFFCDLEKYILNRNTESLISMEN